MKFENPETPTPSFAPTSPYRTPPETMGAPQLDLTREPLHTPDRQTVEPIDLTAREPDPTEAPADPHAMPGLDLGGDQVSPQGHPELPDNSESASFSPAPTEGLDDKSETSTTRPSTLPVARDVHQEGENAGGLDAEVDSHVTPPSQEDVDTAPEDSRGKYQESRKAVAVGGPALESTVSLDAEPPRADEAEWLQGAPKNTPATDEAVTPAETSPENLERINGSPEAKADNTRDLSGPEASLTPAAIEGEPIEVKPAEVPESSGHTDTPLAARHDDTSNDKSSIPDGMSPQTPDSGTGAPTNLRDLFENRLSPPELSHLALLQTSDDPSDPNSLGNEVMVRYFPAEHQRVDIDNVAEAEEIIQASTEQLELLRAAGIDVPQIFSTALQRSDGKVQISSLVARVDGEPFTNWTDWSKQQDEAGQQDVAKVLAEGLIDYYDTALETGAQRVLSDIARPWQYAIADGKPTLLDTDPIMSDLRTEEGVNRVLNELNKLDRWVGNVQPREVGQVLRERVERLVEKYYDTFPDDAGSTTTASVESVPIAPAEGQTNTSDATAPAEDGFPDPELERGPWVRADDGVGHWVPDEEGRPVYHGPWVPQPGSESEAERTEQTGPPDTSDASNDEPRHTERLPGDPTDPTRQDFGEDYWRNIPRTKPSDHKTLHQPIETNDYLAGGQDSLGERVREAIKRFFGRN